MCFVENCKQTNLIVLLLKGCCFFGIGGFMTWGGGAAQRFFSVFNVEEIRICCSIAFQEAGSLVLSVPSPIKRETTMCHFSPSAVWILLARDTLNFPQCAYLQMVVFRLQWSRLTCCLSGKQPCVCSQLQKQSVFGILLKLCWSCRQYLGNKASVPYVTSIKADFLLFFLPFDIYDNP